MARHPRKKSTILYFSCDCIVLALRSRFVSKSGYRVLVSSNGFETMELCSRGKVDAVVLDLDHSHVETALIAREIKRLRPRVPVVMLTDAPVRMDDFREFADAVVPINNDGELVKLLEKLLPLMTSGNAVA